MAGTLFEAFLIRNQLDDYIAICKDYGITYIEVSDGSITIPHAEKCGYIEKLTKYATVLSEVGSKDAAHIIPPYKWIQLMRAELEAGSSYVIAEARESGNVGIYRGSGEVREGLVNEILTQIPGEKILWEAPQKEQQLYFLELLGCNVNLGNIAPNEIIPLETMRIGLRGDTFHLYLDELTKAKNVITCAHLELSAFPCHTLFPNAILLKNLSRRVLLMLCLKTMLLKI